MRSNERFVVRSRRGVLTTLDASVLLLGPKRIGSSGRRDLTERFVKRGDEIMIQRIRKGLGADISGHRPEDLRILDSILTDRAREVVHRTKKTYESVPIALGCYLGEVFVRNLAARWRTPSLFQAIVASVSPNPFKAERYFYIVLVDRKVYVFAAAREAIDKTSRAFSLYDFYQQYARGSTSP